MGKRFFLNDGWRFSEQFKEELLRMDYDDTNMEQVRLPHTVRETPFDYFDESIYQMVSGYRRKVLVPEEWRGKKVLLTIDGAAHDS